jgi:hypothetical protein
MLGTMKSNQADDDVSWMNRALYESCALAQSLMSFFFGLRLKRPFIPYLTSLYIFPDIHMYFEY